MNERLDALMASVDEYSREIRELDRQRAELAAQRRTRLRLAVDEAGMDEVAARLVLTRGQLAKMLNGTWG